MKASIKTLRDHNAWFRGNGTPQESPVLIGMAIDDCIKAAERYKLVRTLNPREFKQLFKENISNGTGFDNLVDALIRARSA